MRQNVEDTVEVESVGGIDSPERRRLQQFGFFPGFGASNGNRNSYSNNNAPVRTGPAVAQQQQQQIQLPSQDTRANAGKQYYYPAPSYYTPTTPSLPTYTTTTAAAMTNGPVTPAALQSSSPFTQQQECPTLSSVLSSIPEASQWLALLRRSGLESVILNDKNTRTTLLVPINSAFSAQIDTQPLRSERSMQELINNAPDIVMPLVGYSVLRGLWPSSTMRRGTALPTSDTIDKQNPLGIRVKELGDGGGGTIKLQGFGNEATVLQKDVAACGPSVLHIIDQIMLPFRFDDAPLDAIRGTRVN